MDPGLSFVQGELQTEENLWPRRQRHSVATLGNGLNYNHQFRPVESDYDPITLREDDYCPYCQKSEVLHDFCSCVNTERGQHTDMRCDCTETCSCATCKPYRQQGGSGRTAATRGRTQTRLTQDTGMTSQVMGGGGDNSLAQQQQQAAQFTPYYRRRQSYSLHSNADREREMAIAARECGIRNLRRRTMSAGTPNDVRVFMKHSTLCECRGSGVGCQCGRICYCD
ncbi:hypothetical protein BDF19DRAFT_410587 [Syncephalis fuscata]|nr:hypothetical protein BDF19DRAFT_410587 [Syncephalis fuscata]